jgi:hypothetical protein
MPDKNSEVLFTVPEFARLAHREEETIRKSLRDGKLKGIQRHKKCLWRIPESELVKYWGKVYGGPRGSDGAGVGDGG